MSIIAALDIDEEMQVLKKELKQTNHELQLAPDQKLNIENRGKSVLYYAVSAKHKNIAEKIKKSAERDATARDAITRDATARDATARDATARDAVARDAIARDATARDATARDATARDAITRDATMRHAITSDKIMIARLARKAFLLKKVEVLKNDIRVLNSLNNLFVPFDDESIINALHPRYHTLEKCMFLQEYSTLDKLKKVSNDFNDVKNYDSIMRPHSCSGLLFGNEWQNAPFETTDYMNYKRKFHINDGRGTRVRSKSEVIIASKLMDLQVPFHYEEILHLSDKKKMIPDFTIKRADGRIFYWEHFGMMNDSEYKNEHDIKLKTYDNYGIYPWNNLIVTYDSEDNPINPFEIEGIIKCKLM